MRIKITSNCCCFRPPYVLHIIISSPLLIPQRYFSSFTPEKESPYISAPHSSVLGWGVGGEWRGCFAVFSFLFFWGSPRKTLQTGKREKEHGKSRKIFYDSRHKISLKIGRKFQHENSCAALMKKIISPQFFMCENSRRDEKSLNDDWRKLQKTQRAEREGRLFSVVSCAGGAAATAAEGGENCYTYTHTHIGERRFFIKISHARVIINFCTKCFSSFVLRVCLMSFSLRWGKWEKLFH